MTVISLFKFEPETVNDCAADAVPATVLNPVKVVGEQLTAGELAAVTAPETATVRLNAGELAKVMFPLGELPLVAEAGIRT